MRLIVYIIYLLNKEESYIMNNHALINLNIINISKGRPI